MMILLMMVAADFVSRIPSLRVSTWNEERHDESHAIRTTQYAIRDQ
jgi:hypothetical protein